VAKRQTGRAHRLGIDAIHTGWDASLPPRLPLEPGDTCVFETREPSQGGVARDICGEGTFDGDPALAAMITAAAAVQPAAGPGTELAGHALTGPVFIAGAEPGDTLLIDVVEVVTGGWGWTACGPGNGLLGDELEEWTLHVWDLRAGDAAIFGPGIRVPMAPFCGVMGVAPAEPGKHKTAPPRRAGGNMDIRQLTAGVVLALPVLVPGALFSVGDVHAAQGDGEVAGTGIETDATVTLRFDLRKGQAVPNPQFTTRTVAPPEGAWSAATGHHANLYEAAREALHGILAYVEVEHGLDRPRGCILASACVDFRISQLVNAGMYTVSAFLPLAIFEA